MARSRGGSDNPVTLFPFLSILACTIGTLVLMISSLAISQIASDPDEELVERVKEYEAVEAAQQQTERSLQMALPKVHELEQYRAALKKLQELLAQLRQQRQAQVQQSDAQRLEVERLLELEKRLNASLAERQGQRQTVQETLLALRDELAQRKLVLEAPTVCVAPADGARGAAVSAVPVFVEADAKGLILDPGGKRERVPAARVGDDARFKQAIATAVKRPNRVLVLLVREDGYATYSAAEQVARTEGALVAKLPILGKGMLDLSRF